MNTLYYKILSEFKPVLNQEQLYNVTQMLLMCGHLRDDLFESIMKDETLFCYGVPFNYTERVRYYGHEIRRLKKG
jgi:hypothetical protein